MRSASDWECVVIQSCAGFRFVQNEQRWRSWAKQRRTEGEKAKLPVGEFASVQRTQEAGHFEAEAEARVFGFKQKCGASERYKRCRSPRARCILL